MPEIRTDIKERLKKNGKTIADLGRHLDKNYDQLSSYLNGRKKMPLMWDLRIEGYFKDLENAPV
jgi:hypothetical protein